MRGGLHHCPGMVWFGHPELAPLRAAVTSTKSAGLRNLMLRTCDAWRAESQAAQIAFSGLGNQCHPLSVSLGSAAPLHVVPKYDLPIGIQPATDCG